MWGDIGRKEVCLRDACGGEHAARLQLRPHQSLVEFEGRAAVVWLDAAYEVLVRRRERLCQLLHRRGELARHLAAARVGGAREEEVANKRPARGGHQRGQLRVQLVLVLLEEGARHIAAARAARAAAARRGVRDLGGEVADGERGRRLRRCRLAVRRVLRKATVQRLDQPRVVGRLRRGGLLVEDGE